MDGRRREELRRQIDELQFVALELNLFLDTHPNDKQALRDYAQVSQSLMRVVDIYQRTYGPLFGSGFGPSGYPWQWIEEPWPWEIEY